MLRTQLCGTLNKSDIGKTVILCGWVHSIRDHGGVLFVDLRDRSGIVQIVFRPLHPQEKEELATPTTIFETDSTFWQTVAAITQSLNNLFKPEYVITVKGIIVSRPTGTENTKLKTGEIELVVQYFHIDNEAKVLPFELNEFVNVSEEIRLRYRFLDLRRERMWNNLSRRHQVYQTVRTFFSEQGFIEIETPYLTKSTPEGARDFLVPSRLNPGKFYALPQSPQLFKQILMCAGVDKYFQIVRCFRDEDLRADRQPEFTQIDLECSFVDENDIINLSEQIIARIFQVVKNIELPLPFPRMDYTTAKLHYGTDKPDLRFDLKIYDLTDIFRETGFKVFANIVKQGGVVRALCVPGLSAHISRQKIDDLVDYVKSLGGSGLAWLKVTPQGFESPIAKFLSSSELEGIKSVLSSNPDDMIFFVADKIPFAATIAGSLRLHLSKMNVSVNQSETDPVFKFLWVTDFPLFEFSEEEKRWVSNHHPFTAPAISDEPLIYELADKKVISLPSFSSRAYDLVLNGQEIGGGSIRIHQRKMQETILNVLGYTSEQAQERFGFLLDALDYGAPPHGGIAFGLDRIIALLCEEDSIREVIAFPKTQKAYCPLSAAPGTVSVKQLNELSIRTLTPSPQTGNG